MRVGDEQPLDEVVFLGRGGHPAAPAASLRAVVGERLGLGVAAVRERHHHVLRRDQVFQGNVFGDGHDLASARVAEILLHLGQLLGDDRDHAGRLVENVQQIGDLLHHLAVLVANLVLLEPGQALQPQL